MMGTQACPVCNRTFRDRRGLGGHVATWNDDAHAAHRAHVGQRIPRGPDGQPTNPATSWRHPRKSSTLPTPASPSRLAPVQPPMRVLPTPRPPGANLPRASILHEAATLAQTILDRNARTKIAPTTNTKTATPHAISPAPATLNDFRIQREPFTPRLPRAAPRPVSLPNPNPTLPLDKPAKPPTGPASNPGATAPIQGATSSRVAPADGPRERPPDSSNDEVPVDPLTALQVTAALLQPKPGAEPRPWSTWHPLVKAAVIAGGLILATWGLARFMEWLRAWWAARRRERDATFSGAFASQASTRRLVGDVEELVRSGWPREAFA